MSERSREEKKKKKPNSISRTVKKWTQTALLKIITKISLNSDHIPDIVQKDPYIST